MDERGDPAGRPAPQVPGDRRRLDRAPGERYAAPRRDPATSGAPRRSSPGRGGSRSARTNAVVAAVLVAAAGGVLFFLLGLLDLGIGMVPVAAFVGWVTGVALIWWGRDAVPTVRTRVGLGGALAGGAIAVAILIEWGYSLVQGGALDPAAYVVERYGLTAALSVAAAAIVAALRAR